MSGTSITPKPGQLVLWQRERGPEMRGRVASVTNSTVTMVDGTQLHRGTTWFGDPDKPQLPVPDPNPEPREPQEEEKECFCCEKEFRGSPDSRYCPECIKAMSVGDEEEKEPTMPIVPSQRIPAKPKAKRVCAQCKADFQPNGPRQIYCPDCGKARMAANLKKYKERAKQPPPVPSQEPPAESQSPAPTLKAELNALSTRELIEGVLGRAKSIRLEIELN
jgi:hypothetical protein